MAAVFTTSAHAQNYGSIRSCIDAGVDSIEHGSELDVATVAMLRERRIYLDMAPLHRLEAAGKEFADSTTHFQDALNDVLAGGKKLF